MSLLTGIQKVRVPAPAKINLFLSVGGEREDGFHELRTVLAKVKLQDMVEIERSDKRGKTEIFCKGFPELENKENLAVQMVDLWRVHTGCDDGIKISIEKNIPFEAGLGGGSSDAVAALIGLNSLSQEKLSFDDMCGLSAKVGSDCPSFLISGTCVASGRGEKVRDVDSSVAKEISGQRIFLFKPCMGFSTAEIYRQFRKEDRVFHDRNKVDEEIENWETGKLPLLEFMHNDLLMPVCRKYLFIPALFEQIADRFSLKPMVSGSGSCCFVIVSEELDLEPVRKFILESWGNETFFSQTHLI